jgi:predicted nucleic acid-binding Zn ribbon protein
MRQGSDKSFSLAFDIIRQTLANQDLDAGLRPHMAKARWEEVVGPLLASVTEVEKVIGGSELVVRAKNSVWANELTLLKGDILQRLNRALGEPTITDIRFKANGLTPAAPASLSRKASVTPCAADLDGIPIGAEEESRISAIAEAVEDDELRAKIRRSLIRAAQSTLWKQTHGWRPCESCGAQTPPTAADPILCDFCRLDTDIRR